MPESPGFLPRAQLERLIGLLREDGRRVIGPTVSDGAIVYDEVTSIDDLPAGWHDEQAAGRYRLRHDDGRQVFGYASSPTSWKRFTFPPLVPISRVRRDGSSLAFEAVSSDAAPMAFLGVRGCDLAALRIHDRVLSQGPVQDADYTARRQSAVVVAVNCTRPASTCFCTSMGTGPEVGPGYDLALTELDDGFLVDTGSPLGAELAGRLGTRPATTAQAAAAATAVGDARSIIGNPVDTGRVRDGLLTRLEDPRWAQVAERCLSCSNCTLVCPTCFCTGINQRSDLAGQESVSERVWNSCFSDGFARVAGGDFRPRSQDRYRQWLTHKFATWVDQFGSSGCVGCGRCIAWCPAGIDVREELSTFTATQPSTVPLAIPRATPSVADGFSTATVREVRVETADTTTLALRWASDLAAAGRPGQFVMLTRPGLPAIPMSVSRFTDGGIELTIRAAGPASATLASSKPGDHVGLRGPLGVGWPIDLAIGRDVVIVAGGIGLAPVRPIVDQVLADRGRFGAVRLYYGARTPVDRLYVAEYAAWASRQGLEFAEVVDRAGGDWLGRVGVVTQLFDQADWDGTSAVAFVCGPERMMQAAATTLAMRGLAPERTFLSLERHMECGVGLCGHCQMGPYFVCRDGPVFSLAGLGKTFGREGI